MVETLMTRMYLKLKRLQGMRKSARTYMCVRTCLNLSKAPGRCSYIMRSSLLCSCRRIDTLYQERKPCDVSSGGSQSILCTDIAGSSGDNLHAVAVQAKRVDAELILYVFAPATSDDTPTPPDKVCGTDDCTDGAWHGCTDAALMSTDEVWRCSRKAQQCR